MTLRAKTSKTPRARRETPRETPNLAPCDSKRPWRVPSLPSNSNLIIIGHHRHQTKCPRLLSPPHDSPISRLNVKHVCSSASFMKNSCFFFFFSFVPASRQRKTIHRKSSISSDILSLRRCESASFSRFAFARARCFVLETRSLTRGSTFSSDK